MTNGEQSKTDPRLGAIIALMNDIKDGSKARGAITADDFPELAEDEHLAVQFVESQRKGSEIVFVRSHEDLMQWANAMVMDFCDIEGWYILDDSELAS